jgi:HK97 family phage portal protein
LQHIRVDIVGMRMAYDGIRNSIGRAWNFLKRAWTGSSRGLPARTRADQSGLRVKQYGPADFLPAFYRPKTAFSEFSTERAIQKGLRESVWANTCATKTATNVGQARWWIEQQDNSGRWVRLERTAHPAAELVADPNAEWSWPYLVERQLLALQLTGNGLLDITRRPDGTPVALEEMRPQNVEPVPATRADQTDRYIKEYKYVRDDGTKLRVSSDNVIHMMFPDPDNIYWGMGRLEAAQRVIDVDVDAQKSQKTAIDNLFVPPGYFTITGPDGRPLPKEIAEKHRDQFRETYVGASKAKKIPFFTADVKYTRLSDTPKESDFIASRQLSAEETCAAFWTPPPIAGILRKAIYNNITTLRVVWWEDVLIPYLNSIRDWFNTSFFEREWPGDRIRLVYSVRHIPALRAAVSELLDQQAKKIAQATALIRDLGWTRERAEEYVGLDDQPSWG